MIFTILLIPSFTTANPQFLTLPFNDAGVTIQQGVLYTDGTHHYPEGNFAIDYIRGTIDNSSTWSSFNVVAAASGVAIQSFEKGYGNLVLVKHNVTDDQGRSFFTFYAHLADGSINPKLPFRSRHDRNFSEWEPVVVGEFLGSAGETGYTDCSSPICIHLHFEVFRGGYFQNPVDPYDISNDVEQFTRESYPPLTFPGCGPQPLWTQCPPVPPPPEPSIVVDGNPSDWAGISPIITSTLAPKFRSLSVTNDAVFVYFLVEVPSDIFTGCTPTPPVTRFCPFIILFLDPDLNGTFFCEDGIAIGIDLDPVQPFLGRLRPFPPLFGCGFTLDFPGAVTVVASGRFLEAAVSLSALMQIAPTLTSFDILVHADGGIPDNAVGRYVLR